MSGNVEILREFVENQIRGIYTISFVRVEEVDDSRRATVSLKSDSDILIDNVPIASMWAADGVGIVVPVERGMEGLVFHAQEPLEKQIQQHGEQPPGSERRFQLEDAVLLPMLWLDEDDVPDHDPGELVIEHESGTRFSIDDEGVHIGPELFVDGVPMSEHVHQYSWTDSGGSDTTDGPE